MLIYNVASYKRKECLIKTIESIYNQSDIINVALNSYDKIPKELYDKKIRLLLTNNQKGDAFKFWSLNKYKGYYFTIDDDIIYPSNYSELMVEAVEKYNRKHIITLHGRNFNKHILSYYRGASERFYCTQELKEDTQIQFGGTGVMCFHTDLLKIDMDYFEFPNMADVWIGKYAHENNIPITCIAHNNNLVKLQNVNETIYTSSSHNDSIQTNIVNSMYNKKVIFSTNKCLVIVPVFNEQERIKRCIDSILNQSHRNIRIAIINDGSTDNTAKILSEYKDKRIVIYTNKENIGCYNSINEVLKLEKDYDYFMLQGADDIMLKDRVAKQVERNCIASTCMYTYIKNNKTSDTDFYGHSMYCYSKKVFEKIGYFDKTRYGGDTEYFIRFLRAFGNSDINYIPEILYHYYYNKESLTNKTAPIGGKKRIKYCNKFEEEQIIMKKENIFYRDYEKVYVGMATIPEREEIMKEAVESIIDQCDELHIYLNNYEMVPDFLTNPKIKTYLGKNLGDVGKFYGLQNKKGYCFTIDDDLIYHRTYISLMIKGIMKYKTAVSLHGRIFNKFPIKSYYTGSVSQNYRYDIDLNTDESVHIVGTGCMGWHTDHINFDVNDFEFPNMADIYASIKLHKKNKYLYVLKHGNYIIKDNINANEKQSIWASNHYRDEVQTKLINDNYKYFNLDIQYKEKSIIFAEIEEPKKIENMKIKVRSLKDRDGDNKFKPVNYVWEVEVSTATALFNRGLVEYVKEVEQEPVYEVVKQEVKITKLHNEPKVKDPESEVEVKTNPEKVEVITPDTTEKLSTEEQLVAENFPILQHEKKELKEEPETKELKTDFETKEVKIKKAPKKKKRIIKKKKI